MLTYEEIRERLRDRRPEDVASGTGLAYATVLRYRDGKVKEPPHSIMLVLSDYLTKNGAGEGV
jgi:hypothetical protein